MVGALAFLAVAPLAAASGGFFPTTWGWASLGFLWIAGMALVLRDEIVLSRLELVMLGGLTGLFAWSAREPDLDVRHRRRDAGARAAGDLRRGRRRGDAGRQTIVGGRDRGRGLRGHRRGLCLLARHPAGSRPVRHLPGRGGAAVRAGRLLELAGHLRGDRAFRRRALRHAITVAVDACAGRGATAGARLDALLHPQPRLVDLPRPGAGVDGGAGAAAGLAGDRIGLFLRSPPLPPSSPATGIVRSPRRRSTWRRRRRRATAWP